MTLLTLGVEDTDTCTVTEYLDLHGIASDYFIIIQIYSTGQVLHSLSPTQPEVRSFFQHRQPRGKRRRRQLPKDGTAPLFLRLE